MKGISQIIATVLMLMITIGMAGTVFVYLQSSLTGRVAKQISITDLTCNSGTPGSVYVTVKNLDPKLSIKGTTELTFFFNNSPISVASWAPSSTINTVASSRANITCVAGSCDKGDTVNVKVVGPDNSAESDTVC